MKTVKQYGAWREGVSGGNEFTEQEIRIDQSNDTSLDISFTATISGEYTHGNTGVIGTELGVTVGVSQNYSFGSGTSVIVPAGSHWMIKYRPAYYRCKVIEETYQETYQNGYLLARHLIETNISYVNIFSCWDYTVVNDPLP